MHRLNLRVLGRVQGVGFRYFVLVEARSLGLVGMVRNLPDGAVEIEAEGERAVLEQFLARVRRGPPHARVVTVETSWSEGAPRFRRFEVHG